MTPPKTLEANSIPIPPQLAGLLKQALGKTGTGFDEGAFLQQLHYWTVNSATTGWIVDGVKWIYNSLKSWQQQFPWMSEYGLRKAIANLKKLGLIETAQHWISSYKRVMFYRIDYERLQSFAGETCDLSAPRCVNCDHLDVRPDHTTNTETSSDTSNSEQQTVVVAETNEPCDDGTPQIASPCDQTSAGEVGNQVEEDHPPASSGDNFTAQDTEFPELLEAVAQIVAASTASLPATLKRAIAQFPQRVQPAIAYLTYQQRKRQINNPIGYLYQAIVAGWDLAVPQPTLAVSAQHVPAGFSQWFDRAKAQGLVIAAMTIAGVHHTLHTQIGWVPTAELMQEK